MTESEYERLRELCQRWHQRADADPHTDHYPVGLRGCADDLKAVLDSFAEPVPQSPPPADSCSTCGAEPGELCRYGCAYQASRRARGWKELPTPTVLSVQVLEEIEAIRREMPDDI